MARVELKMPLLGYDMEAGRIAAWTRRPGDSIARGEVVAEIETDKATVEMESTVSGRLLEIVAHPGEEIAVDAVIAFVDDEADPT